MDQDWNEVVIRKKQVKPKNNEEALRTAAKEGSDVDAVKKHNAAKNVAVKAQPVSAKKLENEESDESMTIPKVSRSVAIRIQQARLDKKWTQKELATKINEKQQIINDYESGRAVPSQAVLAKLERILGVKLRGNLD